MAATIDEAAELLTRVRDNKYIPKVPTTKQLEFLACMDREALYGGAAGPGKSYALLMASLMYVDEADYKAAIFRQSHADLIKPGALMDLAGEWLRGKAKFHHPTWHFPSGAQLTFGYLEPMRTAMQQHQGAQYHSVAIDELTQCATDYQYRYLMGRQRRSDKHKHIPIRMRGGCNPGGAGAIWVKERFVPDDYVPGGVSRGTWKIDPDTGEVRPFFSARLIDNPHVDYEDYVKSLMHLDPITRAQWLNGDWTVRAAGMIFRREWWTSVPCRPALASRVRFWDLAATPEGRYTAGVLLAEDMKSRFTVEHCVRGRWTPGERDQVILATAELDGPEVAVGLEEEGGSGGIAQIDNLRRLLKRFTVLTYRPVGGGTGPGKLIRASVWSSKAEQGWFDYVPGNWSQAYFDELELFRGEKADLSDQVDATSGAHELLVTQWVGRFASPPRKHDDPYTVVADVLRRTNPSARPGADEPPPPRDGIRPGGKNPWSAIR